jgi:co-chaperonin GroES (HSP10)
MAAPPSSSLPAPDLPARLAPGWISIYGASSTQGIDPKKPVSKLQFGQVIQLANDESEMPGTVSPGQSVMFDEDDAKQVKNGSYYYWLLPETKIILIENELT